MECVTTFGFGPLLYTLSYNISLCVLSLDGCVHGHLIAETRAGSPASVHEKKKKQNIKREKKPGKKRYKKEKEQIKQTNK